jgi:hypothetical protein
VGLQAWQASERAEDLGAIGRRGAEWLVPSGGARHRAMPVRLAPRRAVETPQAFAPWGRT